ncbi:MAG TPA: nitroreductase family protein [Verrucomicrobiae bacterium]|nr:nitroreductase family protein [Verrucomicrobiae bacterium]
MLKDLVLKNRTYRRFYQEENVSRDTMQEVIELARLTSSGANMQSLRYILSHDKEKNEKIFKTLKWAGYLPDWDGPEEGEKPSAYIVMVNDKRLRTAYLWDHGLAAQSILLGLTEKGLGACQFNNIDRVSLTKELMLPEFYEIVMVLAIGKPKEIVVLDEIDETGNIRYWRDAQGIHHVPKRKLEDLLLDL